MSTPVVGFCSFLTVVSGFDVYFGGVGIGGRVHGLLDFTASSVFIPGTLAAGVTGVE